MLLLEHLIAAHAVLATHNADVYDMIFIGS